MAYRTYVVENKIGNIHRESAFAVAQTIVSQELALTKSVLRTIDKEFVLLRQQLQSQQKRIEMLASKLDVVTDKLDQLQFSYSA